MLLQCATKDIQPWVFIKIISMITKICSLTFSGVDIIDVDVQVQITPGVPNFIIVGLADKTIAESKERVRAALSSIGLSLPAKRIIVNLAPADLIKEGSHFDLAIASAILSAMNVLPREDIMDYLVFGELSLDGSILPVNGALPAAAISRALFASFWPLMSRKSG